MTNPDKLIFPDAGITKRELVGDPIAVGDGILRALNISRVLAGDPTTRPVRGQVVVVEQFGLDEWWLAEPGSAGAVPTYVIPRTDDVVLGGTEEDGDWSRTPSSEIADAIVRRATALVPEVAKARILRHKVGLRPARPEVRLERVGDVIHCYGHGGAGVTLSWGCADDVARLVG